MFGSGMSIVRRHSAVCWGSFPVQKLRSAICAVGHYRCWNCKL